MVMKKAFTLMEVVVVFTLISIISLFAYNMSPPSSTASRSRPAKLAATRVLSAQQTFAAANGRFTPDPAQLFGIGRDLTVTSATSTGQSIVSLAVSVEDTLAIASFGAEGVCFVYVMDSLAVSATLTESTSPDTCLAANFLPGSETALPATDRKSVV